MTTDQRSPALAWLWLCLAAVPSHAAAQPDSRAHPSTQHCGPFAARAALPDVRVTESVAIPASADPRGPRVPHCKVSGSVGREIRFELLLPDVWNRRLVMGGGGGFVGSVDNQARRSLDEGFATVGTDTGHQGLVFLAGWALNDLERQVNFGHLAVHRVAVTAKALVEAYYGERPRFSYFDGCSNGGRQALMEAQRYPEDFDGIIAGAPALSFTRLAAAFVKNAQALHPDPAKVATPIVTPETIALVESRARASCDASDGVADGIIAHPPSCGFSAADLPACPAGQPGPGCVTAAQRAAIARVYAPTTAGTQTVYAGQPVGNEAEPAGWLPWIVGPHPSVVSGSKGRAPSLQFAFGTETFKYFVFNDPDWDYTRYDFSTWARDTARASATLDADNPDLSGFTARGGKLLLWHGWSDPALNAHATIDYYDAVVRRSPEARAHVRLFLAPGVLHCAGGPGPDAVDWRSILRDWVERGQAPERVTARKLGASGQPLRTRPLCAHPARAVYTGSGSADDEASFTCQAPK